jgi:hypothetical protein
MSIENKNQLFEEDENISFLFLKTKTKIHKKKKINLKKTKNKKCFGPYVDPYPSSPNKGPYFILNKKQRQP